MRAPDRSEDAADSTDPQALLAIDRKIRATERTYSAWMRTGLAALASGIAAHALLDEIVAVWRHLGPDLQLPPANARKVPASLLVFVNGFLTVVALTTMIGLWVGN